MRIDLLQGTLRSIKVLKGTLHEDKDMIDIDEEELKYYREKGKLKDYLASAYGWKMYEDKWKMTEKGYEEVNGSQCNT